MSGQDTSMTAQGDLQHSAVYTHSSVSGQTTSLYAHQGGIKAIAANGDLTLRAHTGTMDMQADGDVTVLSTKGHITIYAKDKVSIVGGDSGIEIDGPNITIKTKDEVKVKASTHGFMGGGSNPAVLPVLPSKAGNLPKYDEKFLLVEKNTRKPICKTRYRILDENGCWYHGETDENGYTERIFSENPVIFKKLQLIK